ncbi:hypothetical protein OG792_15580 [Micromonospora sp. NBC_01699]|nr:hypothetical protein [Micromonospora sp. NBC_01699]
MPQRLPVVVQLGVLPADRVQRAGHHGSVTDGLEQVEGPLRVDERLPVTSLTGEHPGDAAVGARLTGRVAEFAVQSRRPNPILWARTTVA